MFQKAAAQGHILAQLFLGGRYLEGVIVPKDLVLAYAWLNLAASQGRDEAIKLRDSTDEQLTPAERIEAQRLSSNWKKGQIIVRERKQAGR